MDQITPAQLAPQGEPKSRRSRLRAVLGFVLDAVLVALQERRERKKQREEEERRPASHW